MLVVVRVLLQKQRAIMDTSTSTRTRALHKPTESIAAQLVPTAVIIKTNVQILKMFKFSGKRLNFKLIGNFENRNILKTKRLMFIGKVRRLLNLISPHMRST